MEKVIQKSQSGSLRKVIASFVAFTFLFTLIIPPGGASAQVLQTVLNLPAPGAMVGLTPIFIPPLIKGLRIHPDNPLEFDFFVGNGDDNVKGANLQEESGKLIRYFLAALTVPEDQLWVNLSPYEKDKIIPESFGQTEMGRDMLAQDYLLKQLTASIIYPEEELGQKFWDRVYKKAYQKFGTTEIPLNTFNKVWIVPEKAVVFEKGSSVFVVESKLKVMLEEDYLSLQKNLQNKKYGTDRLGQEDVEVVSGITSEVVREVLIPEIEKEVNHGATFANLRQIYNSMILATWYKQNLKETLLNQIYVNQNKIKGVDVADKDIKEKIYSQYLAALKKGVYDYIREDYDPVTEENLPRRYFSGGMVGNMALRDGVESLNDPRKLTGGQKRQLGNDDISEVNVQLAEMTAPQAWQEQEYTDRIWELAFESQVDYVNAKAIKEKDLDTNPIAENEIMGINDFLNAMKAQGFQGSLELQAVLVGLLKGTLDKHLKSELSPQLDFVEILDRERVLSQLNGRSIPEGHASDRGIHLTEWKALLHELIAFVGRQHPESLAFEIIQQAYSEDASRSINELLEDKTLQAKFQERLKEGGYDKTWAHDLKTTFIQAGEGIQNDLIEGRSVTLLADLSQADGLNRRDIAMYTPLEKILNRIDKRFQYGKVNLKGKFDEINDTYKNALRAFAKSGFDGDEKEIKNRIKAAEQTRVEAVADMYQIGIDALNPPKEEALRKSYADDYMVALYAFKKVLEMEVPMKQTFVGTIRGSSYTSPDEVMPKFMSKERAIELGLGDEYKNTLDMIKNARQFYIVAYQRYLAENPSVGDVAIENILYDLGISDQQLFYGVGEQSGRSMNQLIEIATSLRKMLLSDDSRISSAMKTQAAVFLQVLFSKYVHNGRAAASIDQTGITVPPEVYEALSFQGSDDEKLKKLKEAEEKAFGIFLFDGNFKSMKGHSLSATAWLSLLYNALEIQYRSRSVYEAITLQARETRSDLQGKKDKLADFAKDEQKTSDQMIQEYTTNLKFPQAKTDFRNGSRVGILTEMPVRLELSAGGIQDASFLSTYRPAGYNILNMAAQLSREDGTMGRSIAVTFEIRDQKDMPVSNNETGQKALVTVESIDLGFTEHADRAGDTLRKTKADFVFDTLVSLGLFPEPIMQRAREDAEKKERDIREEKKIMEAEAKWQQAKSDLQQLKDKKQETQDAENAFAKAQKNVNAIKKTAAAEAEAIERRALEQILDYVLGEGKRLYISTRVRDITAGSGLAVSSLLAMAVATSYDVLLGEQNQDTSRPGTESVMVNRLEAPVTDNNVEIFYQIEISKDKYFDQRNSRSLLFTTQPVLKAGTTDVFVTQTDLVAEELLGPGEYYVRRRRVINKGQELSVKDSRQLELSREDGTKIPAKDIVWESLGKITVSSQGEGRFELDQAKGIILKRTPVTYSFMDDQKSIERAITTSQETVYRNAGLAGTQDEVSGRGGIMLLMAGEALKKKVKGQEIIAFQGGVVPEMLFVKLSDETLKKLYNGMALLRIGISEKAEDTLNQVFANTMRNAAREQMNAWAQLTIEMTKALVEGEIVEVGRLANNGVPARERMAPVSIDPVVLNALEEIRRRYGADYDKGGKGFSYAITGARSTGSVLLFFDPELKENERQALLAEVEEEIKKSIASVGKLGPVEEAPHIFDRWQVSDRGARVRELTNAQMREYTNLVINPARAREEVRRHVSQLAQVMYMPEEIKEIEERTSIVKSSAQKGDPIVMLSDTLNKYVMESLQQGTPMSTIIKDIKGGQGRAGQAATTFEDKYIMFTPAGINVAMGRESRERLNRNLGFISQIADDEDKHLLYLGIVEGKVDLLWNFDNREEILGLIEVLKDYYRLLEEEQRVKREIIDLHKNKKSFAQEEEKLGTMSGKLKENLNALSALTKKYENKFKEFKKQAPEEADGYTFIGPEFYVEIQKEIEEIQRNLEQVRGEQKRLLAKLAEYAQRRRVRDMGPEQIEAQRRELDLKEKALLTKKAILQKAPNPESLPWDHILFRHVRAYRDVFGDRIALLEKAMRNGALVYTLSVGGKGSRFGQNKVKVMAPFASGNETDATFLKLHLRRYVDLLQRFHNYRGGVVHLVVSPFTEDAIEASLDEYAQETGLGKNHIAVTGQGLGHPTWPTEEEFDLDLALRSIDAKTEAERREMERQTERQKRVMRRALEAAQKQDETIRRPLYDETPDINPINKYNPNGNAGPIETLLAVASPIYTEANLLRMGFKLNYPLIAELSEKSPEFAKQLREGMPLAKAALLVKDDGLAVTAIQQGSSRAYVGGNDLALADAMMQIMQNNVMAVAQYANVGGGVEEGGILVKSIKEGTITTLEGQRSLFLKPHLLAQGHTAFATGTVYLNLKRLYEILGYNNEEEYLTAPLDKGNSIRELMDTIMRKDWDALFTIKDRQQDAVGETNKWKVLQREVPLQWVLTWMQQQYGHDAVVYQEVTPDIAFVDDKSLAELYERLERDQHSQATSVHTKLPSGRVEDAQIAVEDMFNWTEFYIKKDMVGLAAESAALAKNILIQAREQGELSSQQVFVFERRHFEVLQRIEQLRNKHKPRTPDITFDDYADHLSRRSKDYFSGRRELYDWVRIIDAYYEAQEKKENPDQTDRDAAESWLESQIDILKQDINMLEILFESNAQELVDVLQDELGQGLQRPLAVAMASRILIGGNIDDVLERYGFRTETLSRAKIFQINKAKEAIERKDQEDKERGRKEALFTGREESTHFSATELAYFRYEYTALFDQVAEPLMQKYGVAPQGMRTSEHRVTLLVDKDATIEEPSMVLKDFVPSAGETYEVLQPSRASNIINAAIRGARVYILTGSTELEVAKQVLQPISRILKKMAIPEIMKKMAIARIKILANDGTRTVKMFWVKGEVETEGLSTAKFEEGQWIKAAALSEKETEAQTRRNRVLVWEISAKAYLRQLFDQKMILGLLGVSETDESAREGLTRFIESLELDRADKELVEPLEEIGKDNNQTLKKSMVAIMEKMLEKWDKDHQTGSANPWREKFRKIFAREKPYDNAERTKVKLDSVDKESSTDEEKVSRVDVEKELLTGKELLTDEEKLYALFYLIHFKDSAGTYVSISGDELEAHRKRDDRLTTLKEEILNKMFWNKVRDRFDAYYKKASKEGKVVNREGKATRIEAVPRGGNGYLNVSFGGVSKQNYIEGMLLDEQTKGHVVVIMGDSVTDQGYFPFVLHTTVMEENTNKVLNAGNKLAPDFKGKFKNLGDLGLSWDTQRKAIIYEGVMTKADHEKLIQADKEAGGLFSGEINKLYAMSRKVHNQRIPIRVLLGDTGEADDQQIEKMIEKGGLVLTRYSGAIPDPMGDGFIKERWGPVGFYAVVDAVLGAAARSYVIPTQTSEALEARDHVLRAMIQVMNARGVKGFEFLVPDTMKTVEKSPSRNKRELVSAKGIRFESGLVSDEQRRAINKKPNKLEELSRTIIAKIQRSLKERQAGGEVRDNSKVHELLGDLAAENRTLSLSAHLRAFDGPGSSNDTLIFIERLTPQEIEDLNQLLSHITMAGAFKIRLKVELASPEDKDKIIYEDRGRKDEKDQNADNPNPSTPTLDDLEKNLIYKTGDRKGQLIKGKGRAYIAAYIFNKIFGLSGLKITVEGVSPMSMSGGLDSSNNGIVLLLIEAANWLTNAGLPHADILDLALRLENYELGGYTGGSGHVAALLGGVFRHFRTSGIRPAGSEKIDEDIHPYKHFSVPLIPKQGVEFLEKHMLVVQAGKEYKDGEASIRRLSVFVNGMWRFLLKEKDKETQKLFKKWQELTNEFEWAIEQGDVEKMAETTMRFVEIRDTLVRIWLERMIKGDPGKTGRKRAAWKKYWEKVFKGEDEPGYALIRSTYEKAGKAALGITALEIMLKDSTSSADKEKLEGMLKKEVGQEKLEELKKAMVSYKKHEATLDNYNSSGHKFTNEDSKKYEEAQKEYKKLREMFLKLTAVEEKDVNPTKDAFGQTWFEKMIKYEEKMKSGQTLTSDEELEYQQWYSTWHSIYKSAGEEAVLATRFYTYGPIADLVEAAKKEGIAIMPQGAGGPGANLTAIDPKGIEHLKEFLERHGLRRIREMDAKKYNLGHMNGVMKGFMEFKVGKNPLQIDNLQDIQDSLERKGWNRAQLGFAPVVPTRLDKLDELKVSDLQTGTKARMQEPAAEASKEKGGIDLNSNLLDLQIRRDNNGVPLPVNQQPIPQIKIDGFMPVIIHITPVSNLPFLLGVVDSEEADDQLAKTERDPLFHERQNQ